MINSENIFDCFVGVDEFSENYNSEIDEKKNWEKVIRGDFSFCNFENNSKVTISKSQIIIKSGDIQSMLLLV